MTEERFSLKDHLFNEEKVSYLAGLLDSAIPGFERGRFQNEVMTGLAALELKERIGHISRVLESHLDVDFEIAAEQIRDSLPPPLDPTLQDGDFGDFIFAPFGKFVEDHGLGHFETSISLMRELTMRFSMEGPIRLFLDAYPEETLSRLADWAKDDNYHVRRLVSEGTRPRLPWAPRIGIDIRAPLPLLDTLHADRTRYVTRSVANHLNDITKIDPEIALELLAKWRSEGRQRHGELAWMTRHALRTLVKRGHSGAMHHLGYSPDTSAEANLDDVSKLVTAGGALTFSVAITASEAERLIVDYAIGFVKKSGGISSRVYKLKEVGIAAGDTVTLFKSHPLRADATTYTLYPGEHTLMVMINGAVKAEATFEVLIP